MIEARLDVPGGALAYLRGGEGPLVVLSHALGPLAWGPLERLQRACTVAVPVWERSTLSATARAGLGWFDALAGTADGPQATLCAWSMAGPAALRYAATRPARLGRLLLVDVAGLKPGLPPLRWRDVPHVLVTQLRGRPTRGFVRAMWRSWVHEQSIDTAPLEAATHAFLSRERGALGEAGGDARALTGRLPEVAVTTLVLAGRHSPVLGPDHGRAIAALLPRGRLVVFERSSHALQLEEPERFEDVVAAFVTSDAVPADADPADAT